MTMSKRKREFLSLSYTSSFYILSILSNVAYQLNESPLNISVSLINAYVFDINFPPTPIHTYSKIKHCVQT